MPAGEDGHWASHGREHVRDEAAHRREHESDGKAIELAVDNLNRRLDELNKLRTEVVTDRSAFLTRAEYNAKHDAVLLRVDLMEKLIDRAEGSVTTWRFLATFLGIGGFVGLALAIVNAFRIGV
jgi:hypothetical protein